MKAPRHGRVGSPRALHQPCQQLRDAKLLRSVVCKASLGQQTGLRLCSHTLGLTASFRLPASESTGEGSQRILHGASERRLHVTTPAGAVAAGAIESQRSTAAPATAAGSLLCPEGTCNACGLRPSPSPAQPLTLPVQQLGASILLQHHSGGRWAPTTPRECSRGLQAAVHGATRLFGTCDDECPCAGQAAAAGMARHSKLPSRSPGGARPCSLAEKGSPNLAWLMPK